MRRVLAASAGLGYLIGMVTICSLSIDERLAVLAAAIWSTLAAAQWFLISFAHKRYRLVRIHSDGTTKLLGNDGEWHSAIICKESVVLSTIAWLKLKPARGGTYFELLRRDALGNEQWRRLQVIWRHLGTAGRSC